MTAKEAKEKLEEISKKTKLTDFRYTAFVSMKDGSTFLWRNSFALNYQEFLLIFTEHFGNHFFHKDDINHFAQYEKTNIEPLKCNL